MNIRYPIYEGVYRILTKQQDLSGKTTGDFKKTTRSFEINNRFFGKRMS